MLRIAIDPVERLSLALGAGAVALSFAFGTPRFAMSLAAGAALEAVNLRGLLRGSHALFESAATGQATKVGFMGARFGLLALGIYVAIAIGADPAGLLIGLSVAVPAAIVTAWMNRPPVIEHELLPPVEADDESWDRWSVWRAQALTPMSPVEIEPEAAESDIEEQA